MVVGGQEVISRAEGNLQWSTMLYSTLPLHTTVCAPHITQEENPIVLSFSGKAVVGTLRRHICKVHPLAKLRQGRGSIQQHTTDCDLYANIPCSL